MVSVLVLVLVLVLVSRVPVRLSGVGQLSVLLSGMPARLGQLGARLPVGASEVGRTVPRSALLVLLSRAPVRLGEAGLVGR